MTPRRWDGKTEWIADRKREGKWQDVRVLDADSLDEWLETVPAVHVWASTLLGKRPEDAEDLWNAWQDWSEATEPKLSSSLVLAGREAEAKRVLEWLTASPRVISIRAESRDEAVAILAAAMEQLPAHERDRNMFRAVIARTRSAWSRLLAPGIPLILIAEPDIVDAVPRAARNGHHVLVPLGRADGEAELEIPPIGAQRAAEFFKQPGRTDMEIRALVRLARRSLKTLRRQLAVSPELQRPKWATPAEARKLIPALLAGAWDAKNEGDRAALTELAQCSWEGISEVLARWSNEPDAPVHQINGAWYLVHAEDAWGLLGRYLTRNDLERFEKVAIEVLGEVDPKFDLPAQRRWAGRVLGAGPTYSDTLRNGLAETLAVMGACTRENNASGVSPQRAAAVVVLQLLRSANKDWRLWATLSPRLPLLAEGAPESFLRELDSALVGPENLLSNLFSERNDVLASHDEAGLLWALDTLAWNTEYLGPAAHALVALSKIDKHQSNRPIGRLRDIFLFGFPQTGATVDQRLRVIDGIRERDRDAAWSLMMRLLPEHHSTLVHVNRLPAWRDRTPESPGRATPAEWARGVDEVVGRMIMDAGTDGSHWRDIIKVYADLSPERQASIRQGLSSLAQGACADRDRELTQQALRELVSWHRSYLGESWTLPATDLDALAALCERLSPMDPVRRHAWLFASGVKLLDGGDQDWEALQAAIHQARDSGAQSVVAHGGIDAVYQLLSAVEDAGALGATLGRSTLLATEEDSLLSGNLASTDARREKFARGFAWGRVFRDGLPWVRRKLTAAGREWTAAQKAEVLRGVRSSPELWDLAHECGDEVEKDYWRKVNASWFEEDHVDRAVQALLNVDRPRAALGLLGMNLSRKVPPASELTANALEQLVASHSKEDDEDRSFGHHVVKLVDYLEKDEAFDRGRLARIEWALLPVLHVHDRNPRVLHDELARRPAFFVELICFAFRGEDEEPRRLSDEQVFIARNAAKLLLNWRTVPGTGADGGVDVQVLRNWMRDARAQLATEKRAEIGDEQIGEMLSGAPPGSDKIWPHEAVREVIEEVWTPALGRGVEIGLFNGRAARMTVADGGVSETKLADNYAQSASALADRWSRTAAILRGLADSFRDGGRREAALFDQYDEEDARPIRSTRERQRGPTTAAASAETRCPRCGADGPPIEIETSPGRREIYCENCRPK